MEGWGAHTLNLEVSGVWSPNERTLHINNLELRAVVLALKHWERVVIGKTILVASDNPPWLLISTSREAQYQDHCAWKQKIYSRKKAKAKAKAKDIFAENSML